MVQHLVQPLLPGVGVGERERRGQAVKAKTKKKKRKKPFIYKGPKSDLSGLRDPTHNTRPSDFLGLVIVTTEVHACMLSGLLLRYVHMYGTVLDTNTRPGTGGNWDLAKRHKTGVAGCLVSVKCLG